MKSITNVSLSLLLLVCQFGYASDFMTRCMDKKRPAWFDEMISANFEKVLKKRKLGTEKVCEELKKPVAEATVVVVPPPDRDISIYKWFPQVSMIAIHSEKKITKLDIGNHPGLKFFSLGGPMDLADLGDLLDAKAVTGVGFSVDEGGDAKVDVSRLHELPRLSVVGFSNVTISHAKSLEKITNLEIISLENAKLDETVDWKVFSKLRKKEIKP